MKIAAAVRIVDQAYEAMIDISEQWESTRETLEAGFVEIFSCVPTNPGTSIGIHVATFRGDHRLTVTIGGQMDRGMFGAEISDREFMMRRDFWAHGRMIAAQIVELAIREGWLGDEARGII